jgi:crossover junction endodeoxyribonuclease RusA
MTAPVFVVAVLGQPAPQGSKQGFVNKHTGRVTLVESSKAVKPWREAVRSEAVAARAGAQPLDCPVVVDMVFTLAKPTSLPKTRRSWPMRKPDLSKLIRSTEDALTDAGVLADDARIVEFGRCLKTFPGEDRDSLDSPGVLIRIWRVEDLTPVPIVRTVEEADALFEVTP